MKIFSNLTELLLIFNCISGTFKVSKGSNFLKINAVKEEELKMITYLIELLPLSFA